MDPKPLVLAALVVILPAAAQEVCLVDGSRLVGAITKTDAGVRVATLDGPVDVAEADIARRRTQAELRAELRELERRFAKHAHARLDLARRARHLGLANRMWHHLDACLQRQEAGDAATQRLEDFLASLEPELLPPNKRQARIERRVRALLKTSGHDVDGARARAVELVLAGLDGASPELRRQARIAGSPRERAVAIRALGRSTIASDAHFVFRSAILDTNDDVREAAMATAAARRDPQEAIEYLAPGLLANEVDLRVRTAEAFGNLGDAAALPLLRHATNAVADGDVPSGAVRGHIAIIRQQAYIRDFDVEVAQAAFIADPKVGVLQEGVVLDATLISVTPGRVRLTRAYGDAIEKIAKRRTAGDETPSVIRTQ